MNRTPEQSAVTSHVNGPALVLSVAGSGKTTTMIGRVAHLVKSGVRPQKILVTTFSRLGAADMRKKALELGVRSGVEFRTIHSVVWSMVKQAFPKKKLPGMVPEGCYQEGAQADPRRTADQGGSERHRSRQDVHDPS